MMMLIPWTRNVWAGAAVFVIAAAAQPLAAQVILRGRLPDAPTASDAGDLSTKERSPGRSAPSVSSSEDTADEDGEVQRSGPRPCVLLRNGNVLFGTASQLGEYVLVTRGPGNEIRLPRKEVACWATSLPNLYQYRVDHRANNSVSSYLDDALWCLRYDLYELAEREVEAALRIAPDHPDARRLRQRLRKTMAARSRSGSDRRASEVRPVAHDEVLSEHAAQTEEPGLHEDALAGFAGDIQPMLINRCGACHSHTSSRRWKITTPLPGARLSSRVTRDNLLATIPFINRQRLESSELWVNAVTAHGGAPAGLNARMRQATSALQWWLESFASTTSGPAASSPRAGSPGADSSSQSERSPKPEASIGPEFPQTPNPAEPDPGDETESPSSWRSRRPGMPGDSPARLPRVANPFDPDLFNRQYHQK